MKSAPTCRVRTPEKRRQHGHATLCWTRRAPVQRYFLPTASARLLCFLLSYIFFSRDTLLGYTLSNLMERQIRPIYGAYAPSNAMTRA